MEQQENIEISVVVDSDEKALLLFDILSDIQYPTQAQIERMMRELREEFAAKRAREFLGEDPNSPTQ